MRKVVCSMLFCSVLAYSETAAAHGNGHGWGRTETAATAGLLIGVLLARGSSQPVANIAYPPAPVYHTVCTDQPIVDSGWRVVGWRRVCEQRPVVSYQ